MRVLLVNKFLVRRGGVETYVLDLGRLLQEAGHEVQYFGMDDSRKLVGNDWGIYAENVELGGGQGVSRIKDVPNTIRSRRNYTLMSQLLEAFQPDVVHFNNIHYHLTPSVIQAAACYRANVNKSVTLVQTMHDYHAIAPCDGLFSNRNFELCEKCLDGKVFRCFINRCVRGGYAKALVASAEGAYWNHARAYNELDVAICPSNYLRQRYDSSSVFYSPTIHLTNFSNVERRKYPKDRYFLYFGGYYRNKGVETLLNILSRHPEIDFHFAGDGHYRDRMHELPNVTDHGFLSGEELREVVGKALLAVLPSEWPENSPFSVIEALCSGTPVLGANIGGIPELVEGGVTGELFRFRDIDDLENKLVTLWNNSPALQRYAEGCEGFEPMSPSHYLEEITDIYRGTIRSHV